MNVQQFVSKSVNKLSFYSLRAVGIDFLTGLKISPRHDLQRIGTKYGGWVIPRSLLHAHSVCYCVGCGEDISFDLGLIEEFGCDVYGFDPTPRAIQYVEAHVGNNPKYHFFAIGLWDKRERLKFYAPKDPTHVSHSLLNLWGSQEFIEVQVEPLKSVMQANGHTKLALLKLDIEGAEYQVLDSVLADNLDVSVICVEYDEYFCPLDGNYPSRIKGSIEKLLNAGYALICSQGNGNYTFLKTG